MAFPGDVDCLIVGTGLGESILSAGLSVLGKQVLHIDRCNYYGGRLASFRFPDLVSLLQSNSVGNTSVCGRTGVITRSDTLYFDGYLPTPIMDASCDWFLSSESDGDINQRSTLPFVPDPPIVLTETTRPTVEPTTVESETVISDVDDHPPISTSTSSPPPPVFTMWSRSEVEECMRRTDIDLLPKMIYADSPIVTAMLRSDVTRYLEFRSISRCLAYTTVSSPVTSNLDPSGSSDSKPPPSSPSNPSLVQIPVGRSELFKTRLLSLRQKRALGSFFETCFHLTTDESSRSASASSESPLLQHYEVYADRPFRDWLQNCSPLDEFSQQLITVNLAFTADETTTREAVRRICKLLLSLNRFGPHPLLWPLYGCGDLPQSFCRMSAVFGGVFCLNCGLDSVRSIETGLGDAFLPGTEISNQPSTPRRFISQLSNNREVRSSCVVVGAECLPFHWVESSVKRWCARAILLTDRSIYPDGRKPVDVSLLALPLSGRGNISLDPAMLLEIPVESANRTTNKELFVVHLTAVTTCCMNAAHVFRPIVDKFFTTIDSAPDTETDSTTSNCPRLLWAGYFCIPDLSNIDPLVPDTAGTQFTPRNGFFLFPGPDSGFDLDSTVVTAESVFRDIMRLIGSHQNGINSAAPVGVGDNDGVESSSLTATGVSNAPEYISLDARWDGVFPPRPPNPDDIVMSEDLQTEAHSGEVESAP